MHTTVTDRHGAGEAQVEIDTAHDSAQVETIDDRDLSTDRKNADNIETAAEEIHDAVLQSFKNLGDVWR